MRLTLAEIAEAVNGEIVLPEIVLPGGQTPSHLTAATTDFASLVANGISIDSRTLEPGQLFVPLVAEHDGHDYIGAAIEAGAVASLSARKPEDAWTARRRAAQRGKLRGGSVGEEVGISGHNSIIQEGVTSIPLVVVRDTAAALTQLAETARARLGNATRVIGITGSVGKTTAKDFCSAAIGATLRCWASEKSFNNEIGLPLTLLNAPDDCEVLVAEMGASRPGDIASLCQIARPYYGILTSIAIAHTESFGTIDQIAHTKAELLEALPADGVAVINRDDKRVMAQAERVLKRWEAAGKLARQADAPEVLTFGLHPNADVRAEGVSADEQLHAEYLLRSPWGSERVRLGVAGLHNVGNSLAAAAVALHLGVPVEAVAEGLSGAEISPWRMSLGTSPSGVVVLNDSYNANPASMEAALRALAQLPARRHLAVLGTMAELGEYHDPEHRHIAALAEGLGVKVISVAEPAYGLEDLPDATSALAALGDLDEGDAVLVKGSRVAGLELLAENLLES